MIVEIKRPEAFASLTIGPALPASPGNDGYHAAAICERGRDGRWYRTAIAHWHAPTGTLHNVHPVDWQPRPADETIAALEAAARAATGGPS